MKTDSATTANPRTISAVFVLLLFAGVAAGYASYRHASAMSIVKSLYAMNKAHECLDFTGVLRIQTDFGQRRILARIRALNDAPDRCLIERISFERLGNWDEESHEETSPSRHPGRRERAEGHRRPRSSFRRAPFGRGMHSMMTEIPDPERLVENYDVTAGDGETIAGRDSLRILISPRYPGRPQRILWLDRENSLLLKSQFISPEGAQVFAFEFEELELNPNFPPDAFEAQSTRPPREFPMSRTEVAIVELQTLLPFPLYEPYLLPEGFSLKSSALIRGEDYSAAHLLYTDGLLTVSLFEHNVPPEKGEAIWHREDAPADAPSEDSRNAETLKVNKRSFGLLTVLGADLGEVRIVVIGAIPADELVRMISSFE